MLDKSSALWHSGKPYNPEHIKNTSLRCIGDCINMDPMSHEAEVPPRQNLRSLKSLARLAAGYLLTASCFWIAFEGVVQNSYGVTGFGLCSGLFFGLGCVVLTKATIKAPRDDAYSLSVAAEDDDSTDDLLDE
jgi:hypothetical protein